ERDCERRRRPRECDANLVAAAEVRALELRRRAEPDERDRDRADPLQPARGAGMSDLVEDERDRPAYRPDASGEPDGEAGPRTDPGEESPEHYGRREAAGAELHRYRGKSCHADLIGRRGALPERKAAPRKVRACAASSSTTCCESRSRSRA